MDRAKDVSLSQHGCVLGIGAVSGYCAEKMQFCVLKQYKQNSRQARDDRNYSLMINITDYQECPLVEI